eukprot:3498017-Pyramimonas_sp.AAC.1
MQVVTLISAMGLLMMYRTRSAPGRDCEQRCVSRLPRRQRPQHRRCPSRRPCRRRRRWQQLRRMWEASSE